MDLSRTVLHPEDPEYPASVERALGCLPPLHIIGEQQVLARPLLAVVCSVRCPGTIILQMYDLTQRLKLTTRTLACGFHSPMERECLTILLSGCCSILLCPARGVERMRIPVAWRKPMAVGRLTVLSPFDRKVRRANEKTAAERNRLVAAMSAGVLMPYAAPGGKTELLAREIVSWGKPLFTFDDPADKNLLDLGAAPIGEGFAF